MASTVARSTAQRPVPAHEKADQLFVRWRRHGDELAREELVRRFMPLARSLARRYEHSSEPFEDLLQVASLGLLKALDRFDPELGHPFPSFAVPTILGEMRRYFRDSGWSVHMPRGAQERALKVRDAQERLAEVHGRAPSVNQLAEYLECSCEEVLDALQAVQAYEAVSLDAPRLGVTTTASPMPIRWDTRTSATSSSSSTPRSAPCSSTSRRVSVASCTCASSRTSRRRRSPPASASHRCRSRACCAARSSTLRALTRDGGQIR